jgi:hypothetical protein
VSKGPGWGGFGGAGRFADSVYNRAAPGFQSGSAGEAYVSGRGYSSNEERLVSESYAAATRPSSEIRNIRPEFAKMPLFPPRFGYPQGQITIDDVVQVDRRYPDSSSLFSGTSGGYTATAGPSLGWW